MKFIKTFSDIIITAIGISLIVGVAYFLSVGSTTQDFTFAMSSLEGISLENPQVQGCALVIVSLAIGLQLFKSLLNTDQSTMA